jgi:hypothetical protein
MRRRLNILEHPLSEEYGHPEPMSGVESSEIGGCSRQEAAGDRFEN